MHDVNHVEITKAFQFTHLLAMTLVLTLLQCILKEVMYQTMHLATRCVHIYE